MKTIFYILIALFITASVTSCTTDSIADEDISIETFATEGEDEHMEGEDEG
ncbi:hypothetical protein [Aquimarina sp. AU474]|uniref:hypothetical protein n=1 Tax=Aquimarina sp. AU474 TaxID=2108529 RepID=UPI00135A30C5|nr:hypothetical protein [Aquimarina sp. AU474]